MLLFFDKIIAKGIEAKDFNTEDPIMLRMFILGAMNWIQQWYKPNGRLSKKRDSTAILELYFETINIRNKNLY